MMALVLFAGAIGLVGCEGSTPETPGPASDEGLPAADGATDAERPDAADAETIDALTPDSGAPDAGRPDASDATADLAPPPDASEPLAPFGAACVQDIECADGRCIALGPLGRGRCGGLCPGGDCPPGGRCVADPSGAPVCVPESVCADFDGDGHGIGATCEGLDCDDGDSAVHPGAEERCDGRDNNCDGRVDGAPVDADVACVTGRPGICAPGWALCTLGVLSCVASAEPGEEQCNGVDDDCDGQVDEAVFEPCGSDVGACQPGRRSCVDGAFGDTCEGEVGPQLEVCNGIDTDCNGLVDDRPLFGLGHFADLAWPQATDRPRVAVDPQGRALVAYSSAGFGNDRPLQALLVDPARQQTLASSALAQDTHADVRPMWVGDEWWVTGIRQAGSGTATLSIMRLDAMGRPLAPLAELGPEVDDYALAAHGGEVAVYWLNRRDNLHLAHWQRDQAGSWQRTDREIDGATLSLDQAPLISADDDGWVIGREVRVGDFDSRFEFARWTPEAGVGAWVRLEGIRRSRPRMARWGEGHAFFNRNWKPPTGTALEAIPINARLNLAGC